MLKDAIQRRKEKKKLDRERENINFPSPMVLEEQQLIFSETVPATRGFLRKTTVEVYSNDSWKKSTHVSSSPNYYMGITVTTAGMVERVIFMAVYNSDVIKSFLEADTDPEKLYVLATNETFRYETGDNLHVQVEVRFGENEKIYEIYTANDMFVSEPPATKEIVDAIVEQKETVKKTVRKAVAKKVATEVKKESAKKAVKKEAVKKAEAKPTKKKSEKPAPNKKPATKKAPSKKATSSTTKKKPTTTKK